MNNAEQPYPPARMVVPNVTDTWTAFKVLNTWYTLRTGGGIPVRIVEEILPRWLRGETVVVTPFIKGFSKGYKVQIAMDGKLPHFPKEEDRVP